MEFIVLLLMFFFYVWLLMKVSSFLENKYKKEVLEKKPQKNCPPHLWKHIIGVGHVCEWCNVKAGFIERD